MSAAALTRQSRQNAGLSRRALATKVGVPTSTISRIEDGSSDPTVTMLARIISATGHELTLSADAATAKMSIATLTNACVSISGDRKIAWHRLRGFLDQIAAHPDRAGAAIETPPARTGDRAFDALLAGIAEKVADDASLTRPRWTRSVPTSPTAWESPGTPAMVARGRAHAPEQLSARNIWLSERDLWRDTA